MKIRTLLLLAAAWLYTGIAFGQDSPVGIWKTIDDETGEAKSHVEIYEKDGVYHGKIVKLLQVAADKTCDECPGDKKDKPLMGMEVVWDLEPYKDYWSYGRIMDPNNGKTYKCSIWLENADQLEVRGYLGISALGRTQTWYRIK
ncbi:MAG: DUF2147 domain-containing protein [Bacteroidetes bacterium]|nr:DUF2147 domain-containing protein [Bacteroidota bacterium]